MDYSEVFQSFTDYQDVFMEDTDFYTEFLKLERDSPSTFTLINKRTDKLIESDWVNIIEDALPSLDKCIRKPRKFIENRDEVLPIELSRNITAESIKHLSQHTNFISSIEGDKIIPNKILNVFKEESMNTYENKFVCTLVNNLFIFISRRNSVLSSVPESENYSMLKMDQEIQINDEEKLEISLEIKSTMTGNSINGDDKKGFVVDVKRVDKINRIIAEYMSTPFFKEMKTYGFIRPPVMRTNAIMKDVDLRKCLDLWLFIESYNNVGFQVNAADTAIRPSDSYIGRLYGVSAIEYALFKNYTTQNMQDDMVLRKVKRKRALVPKFVKDIFDELTVEFNMDETQFKKLMENQIFQLRKNKNADEVRIKKAISDALKSEKQLEKTIELQKIKQEKANEKKNKKLSKNGNQK